MKSKVFIFPLRSSLTLRKVALPFHIFETRYRQMVNDALEQQLPIAVLPILDGRLQGRVCYGGIPQLLHRYDDGRMEIAISGDLRCRLGEVTKDQPYLVCDFEQESEDHRLSERSRFARDCIFEGLMSWGEQKIPGADQLETFKGMIADPEGLLSYGTLFLVEDMEQKMGVVEERSWDLKAEMIFKALGPKEVSLGPFLPPLKWK